MAQSAFYQPQLTPMLNGQGMQVKHQLLVAEKAEKPFKGHMIQS
jgi:hypothetical protein